MVESDMESAWIQGVGDNNFFTEVKIYEQE